MLTIRHHEQLLIVAKGRCIQVVYQHGVNEKLLGDFIRKHNVRDKVFRKSIPRSTIA